MYRAIIIVVILICGAAGIAVAEVGNTVHNLSVSGPGTIKSQTEDRICIYCHIPHSATAQAPLWNRNSSGGHIQYQSSTSDASPGQTSASSLHCLSCHDGTIALGNLANSRVGTPGSSDNLNNTQLTGRSRLGMDLSNDHPISIIYDGGLSSADTELVHPASVDLPLPNNEMHCTSCHDSHDNSIPPFLHKSTLNGDLCLTCHTASGINWTWASSSHATSNATPSMGTDPWSDRKDEWKGSSVNENSCMNCHTPHNAVGSNDQLVKQQEEHTCYLCHNGSVGQHNIEDEFQNIYRHPVDAVANNGVQQNHSKNENPLSMPLHVECEDCHNPHASFDSPPMISFNPGNPLDTNHSVPPFANGSLAGVRGIDISGNVKEEAEYEYEVCFKCHGVQGDGACNNGRCSTASGFQMERLDGVYNIRDKFDTGNPALISYHPIYANNPSNNNEVPSLRNDIPLNASTSLIYCNDCHSSTNSPSGGGVGPSGPHGSLNEGILSQRYSFSTTTNSPNVDNELCFKCHDSGNLYEDVSFEHNKHVQDEGASCTMCHDPHGSTAGDHLINFLTTSSFGNDITGSGGYAQPTWIDNGVYRGTCYLVCHGEDHNPEAYP